LRILPLDPSGSVASMLGALMFEGFRIAGLQNLVYTLSASIYPPFARATGVGAAAAIGRIGAVVSSYTGVLALQLGGASAYFMIIATAAAISTGMMTLMSSQIPGAAAPGEQAREATGSAHG
jgi:AAHS family 4-hydroxybenzoate transporter-like MFS transporter